MTVLAVRQDNNGDVLLAGPAIRALAQRSDVLLVCGPSGAAAAQTLPGVVASIPFEAAWIEANPGPFDAPGVHDFIARIAAANVEEAVIFTSFHQSALPMALLLRLAGLRRISAISTDYGGGLLDVRHRVSDDLHEVERALSLAAAAGFALPAGADARLHMRVAATNPVAGLRPYVVVHPGATVRARAWDPAKNHALVTRLRERDITVVVTGGHAEEQLCAAVAAPGAIDLSGRTDFPTLARVIADAQAIVVGNTGAAHVAAAVGTPVVSLFAPTVPAARFRPWQVPHVLLGEQHVACAGCRARTCPIPHQPCLNSITPADVIDALEQLATRPLSCAS